MRRAIRINFIVVLVAALFLNGLVFCVGSSLMVRENAKKNMSFVLESMDSLLDYGTDLSGELERLNQVATQNGSRVTLIRMDGSVAADTEADLQNLDNHMEREEVKEAVQGGQGYAIRRSETLNQRMFYAAMRSQRAQMILRIAVPYAGLWEYLPGLLPAAFASFLIAFLLALVVTERFASSVTRPLRDISLEMQKVKGDYTDFHFARCQYPEINIIADTTTQMSKNVKEYLAQIEKERQIRQEFFSNASHELKTPITSIQGYAELLEGGLVASPQMERDFAGRIRKEAVRMAGLINDILMISRLEAKEAQVVITDVRVSVLLEEVLESLKPQAASAQVFVHWECQPIVIAANLQHMRELFVNLIGNAIKYNHPGGEVWVTVREMDGQMLLVVRDNGVGIPQDALERIFERFYRVDKGRSRKQGGTGLGLSIVKHVVNYYHGSIQVTSKLDEGSAFTVKIPIKVS